MLQCKLCGSTETETRKNSMHLSAYCKLCGSFISHVKQDKNKDKRSDKNITWRKMWRDKTSVLSCAICGVLEPMLPESRYWIVDHIIPLEYGGKDEFENTRIVCEFCHIQRHRNLDKIKALNKQFIKRGECDGINVSNEDL